MAYKGKCFISRVNIDVILSVRLQGDNIVDDINYVLDIRYDERIKATYVHDIVVIMLLFRYSCYWNISFLIYVKEYFKIIFRLSFG